MQIILTPLIRALMDRRCWALGVSGAKDASA
jgi:hypothetical protein